MPQAVSLVQDVLLIPSPALPRAAGGGRQWSNCVVGGEDGCLADFLWSLFRWDLLPPPGEQLSTKQQELPN